MTRPPLLARQAAGKAVPASRSTPSSPLLSGPDIMTHSLTSSAAPTFSTLLAHRGAPIARLKALLRTGKDCTPAHHVLYNLLRGHTPRRGFTAPKGRGASTNVAFLQAALRAPKLALELSIDWEPAWTDELTSARRQAHLEDFLASCEPGPAYGPSVLRALATATRLTPHGTLPGGALAHGEDCWKQYAALVRGISQGNAFSEGPRWLAQFGARLRALQQPISDMREYLTYHDCGKSAVAIQDSRGRWHFPGHAAKSAELWRLAGRPEVQARLMELDMALHTLPASQMPELAKDPLTPSLLLATYAQLLSNAKSIFGGLDSSSFQKKLAALNERADALAAAWGWEPDKV